MCAGATPASGRMPALAVKAPAPTTHALPASSVIAIQAGAAASASLASFRVAGSAKVVTLRAMSANAPVRARCCATGSGG